MDDQRLLPLLSCALWLWPLGAAAEPVAAVFGAEAAAQDEAWAGFVEAYGAAAPSFRLAEEEPRLGPGLRVVVAFGAAAARRSYPERVALVYALAPGTWVGPEEHGGPVIEVSPLPSPGTLLESLRAVQPGLKRLAVLWGSPAFRPYLRELCGAALAAHVELVPERVDGASALPDALRGLRGRADALWVPPDPRLLDARTLPVLAAFSRSERLPFYASLDGLAERGAAASIFVPYREMGRAAGRAALRASTENGPRQTVYPERVELVVNLRAAAAAGLDVPPPALERAGRVLK